MNPRIYKFGSALSLLLLGILVGGGFQAPTEKNGVVDINAMIDSSNFGKSVRDTLDKMRTAREDVLKCNFSDTGLILHSTK